MKRAPLVLACLLVQPSGASGSAPCEARLHLLRQEQVLTITGCCRNLLAVPANYRYQLLVQPALQGSEPTLTRFGNGG